MWTSVAALGPETRGAALCRLGGGQTLGIGQASGQEGQTRVFRSASAPLLGAGGEGALAGGCGNVWEPPHWVSRPLVDGPGLEESDCSSVKLREDEFDLQ